MSNNDVLAAQVSPRDSIRWQSIKNMTDEVIPAYACCQLGGIDTEIQEPVFEKGQRIVLAFKPNAVSYRRQDPALLIFNGPHAIQPGQTGQGTQDWPAQVLFDGGGTIDGVSAGPIEDSWWLGAGFHKTAFTVQGYERSTPAIDGPPVLVWVSPAKFRIAGGYEGWRPPGGTAESNKPFDLAESWTLNPPIKGSVRLRSLTHQLQYPGDLIFPSNGVFWLSLSATLSSVDAPEGSPLVITLATGLRDYEDEDEDAVLDGVYTDTYLSGHRTQPALTCSDCYGDCDVTAVTSEQVGFHGPYDAVKDERLRIYNRSGYEMTASRMIFSAFLIAGRESTSIYIT